MTESKKQSESPLFIDLSVPMQQAQAFYYGRILAYEKNNPYGNNKAWKSGLVGLSRASINARAAAYKKVQDTLENAGYTIDVFQACIETDGCQKKAPQSGEPIHNLTQYAQKTNMYPNLPQMTPRSTTRQVPRLIACGEGNYIQNGSEDHTIPGANQINWNIDSLEKMSTAQYEALQRLYLYTSYPLGTLEAEELPLFNQDERLMRAVAQVHTCGKKVQAGDKPEHAVRGTICTLDYAFAGERDAYKDMLFVLQQSPQWQNVVRFQQEQAIQNKNPALAAAWEKEDMESVYKIVHPHLTPDASDKMAEKMRAALDGKDYNTELKADFQSLKKEIQNADKAEQLFVTALTAVSEYQRNNVQTQTQEITQAEELKPEIPANKISQADLTGNICNVLANAQIPNRTMPCETKTNESNR